MANAPAAPSGRSSLRAYIAVLTPLIWGTTYLCTTEFLPPDRPMLAGTLRALPAGIVLCLLGRRLPHRWWGRMVLLSVLYVSAFFPLLFLAAYRLPGGVASVINSLMPIGVTLLSVPVLGTRVRPIHLVGGGIGVLGVGLLVLRSSARLDWLGVGAMSLGVAMMVVATVLTKKWGRPAGMGPLTFTGWTFLLGGAVLGVATVVVEGLPGHLTARNVGGYLYLTTFGAVISYGLWFWCLDRLPASAASFLGLINPVFAAVLGWVVLGQALNGWQLLGGGLVLASVVLGQWGAVTVRSRRRSSDPEPAELTPTS